jgi:hypothetical protein
VTCFFGVTRCAIESSAVDAAPKARHHAPSMRLFQDGSFAGSVPSALPEIDQAIRPNWIAEKGFLKTFPFSMSASKASKTPDSSD